MEQPNKPTLEQLRQSASTFKFIHSILTQRQAFYSEEFQLAHVCISTVSELVKSLQNQIDELEKVND